MIKALLFLVPAGVFWTMGAYSLIFWVSLIGSMAAFVLSSKKQYREIGPAELLKGNEMLVGQEKLEKHYDQYASHFGDKSRVPESKEHKSLQNKRESNYTEMVNSFYDLVTDFYEYGWGPCFHFAPRFAGEGFMESLRRHEYFMASRLQLRQGMRCVDLGCGVGGPMRNIARFSGAQVTGVNNSDYQIKIAAKHNKLAGLDHLCSVSKADFMHQPFEDETFDAGYQIEATCHAPDLAACFAEAFRVLKPGALMAGYEWLMTEKYDAKNPRHVAIKQGIEQGNGIPNLRTVAQCKAALIKAGFEIVETQDRCPHPLTKQDVPWYGPLAGEYSLENIRSTKFGRVITSALTWTLEFVRIAPKGTYKVQTMLTQTADDLVSGGEVGIFTPAYFWLARKPARGAQPTGKKHSRQ